MKKPLWTRDQMQEKNIALLETRGVTVKDIAKIAFDQQKKFTNDVTLVDCVDSVYKILSYRQIFHLVQLGIGIDLLVERGSFDSPIQDIMEKDLGVFGIDEIFGLEIASIYGAIGRTNFGDIDVNKPGIIKELDVAGKNSKVCNTFLDDIVGALAAVASTRVAQNINEQVALDQTAVLELE